MKRIRLKRPVRRSDGWWLPDCPIGFDDDLEDMGPFADRAEANERRDGLRRFLEEVESERK